MKRRRIIGSVLAVCLLLALAFPALAGGLTVYGGKIETSVNAASDNSYTMKVANTSDAPMDIGVEVKGYGVSAAQDFIVLEPKDDKSPYTGRELLTVSPTTFHLEPGDSQIITCTAKIPPGIGDGGRYAIVLIHTTPPKGEAVATISAIAARVLLTISGSKLDTNSKITEVSIATGTAQETAGVTVTVANNGNYHYNPQIKAKLRNGDKVVATASLSPGWPIIPGYERQFNLKFVELSTLPVGVYNLDVEVKDDTGLIIASKTDIYEVKEAYIPVSATSNITLKPAVPTTLTTADGRISIDIPEGAVPVDSQLSLRLLPSEQLPSPPAGYTSAATAFKVTGMEFILAKTAEIRVKYSDADLQKAGGDPTRLVLARWDEAGSTWTLLKTGIDKGTQTLSAQSNQLGILAILVSPPEAASRVNWNIIGGAIALVVIIVLLGIFFRPRKKTR